jgi:outer membrane autotransporter protein
VFANRAQTNGAVTLGTGNDVFAMMSGTMCCTVSLGDGNDLAFIFDGKISSDVQAGAGNDTLSWQGGQVVAGIRMGDGNDYAYFSGLGAANLVPGLPIDGGFGNDRLVWSRTQNGTGLDVAQLTYWESIAVNSGSQLTFKNYSALTLGDPGTSTGSLSIDSSSSVLAGNGTHAVRPWNPTELATVSNAGLIDLTNGPATASDRFVVYGNYIGQSGHLNLQTVLGGDGSPSDQLVIQKNSTATATPTATGVTALNISNLNGLGAMTTGDGIRVVDAVEGASTVAGAFALSGRVAAGVYEYSLFRGGLTASSANDNDWFLRSSAADPTVPVAPLPPLPVPPPAPVPPTTLPAPVPAVPVAPLPPAPAPPSPPSPPAPALPPSPAAPTPPLPVPPPPPPPPIDPPPPVPAPPPGEITPPAPPAPAPVPPPAEPPTPSPGETPPPSSGETPATPPVKPLVRPEIPGYVLMPAMAQQMGITTLGTFHQRRGDQSLLDNSGVASSAWIRALGDDTDQQWSSKIGGISYQLAPKIRSDLWGIQAGSDVFASDDDQGREHRAGVFYAHTEAHGDVYGNTMAIDGSRSGKLRLTGDSLGLYWTYIGRNRWYLDTVAMYTRFRGNAESQLGVGADTSGNSVAVSFESGMPFAINDGWSLEPQAQLIWQHIDFEDTGDLYSSIEYDRVSAFTGRLGLRLENNALVHGRPWQTFISTDMWRNFSKNSNVTFDSTNVAAGMGNSALQLRGGVTMKWTDHVATYATVGYTTRLDGKTQHGVDGTIGIRVRW